MLEQKLYIENTGKKQVIKNIIFNPQSSIFFENTENRTLYRQCLPWNSESVSQSKGLKISPI